MFFLQNLGSRVKPKQPRCFLIKKAREHCYTLEQVGVWVKISITHSYVLIFKFSTFFLKKRDETHTQQTKVPFLSLKLECQGTESNCKTNSVSKYLSYSKLHVITKIPPLNKIHQEHKRRDPCFATLSTRKHRSAKLASSVPSLI